MQAPTREQLTIEQLGNDVAQLNVQLRLTQADLALAYARIRELESGEGEEKE